MNGQSLLYGFYLVGHTNRFDMGAVSDFLKDMGNTSEEVAESIRKIGVKGVQKNPRHCPLALAIREKFPSTIGLRVGGNTMTYSDPQTMDPAHTPSTSQFVKDFDAGKYPDLIKEEV